MEGGGLRSLCLKTLVLVFQAAYAAVVDFGDARKGTDVLAVLLGESLEGFDVAGG
jgi:hypothetical protein